MLEALFVCWLDGFNTTRLLNPKIKDEVQIIHLTNICYDPFCSEHLKEENTSSTHILCGKLNKSISLVRISMVGIWLFATLDLTSC